MSGRFLYVFLDEAGNFDFSCGGTKYFILSAIEKAAKVTLARILPKTARYRILHHDSKSNMDLQIVDYCNWAIYRKWDAQDERSYQLIRSVVVSEFDFCRTGTTLYY